MLIWELSKCMRVDNSGDIALCAYTGLVTDTGRFQYQNADSRAFASASEMITAGVDASFVSREVYQNRSEASVLLEACSIKHMKLFCGGQAAISYVTRRDFEKCHAVKADAEALIDTLACCESRVTRSAGVSARRTTPTLRPSLPASAAAGTRLPQVFPSRVLSRVPLSESRRLSSRLSSKLVIQ